MSDKRKKWSLGRFAGDIGGGCVTGATAAATKSVLIPDPTGQSQLIFVAACGAAGAVAGGAGSLWGFFFDDSLEMEFRSAFLFNSVVGIALVVPFILFGYLFDQGSKLTGSYVLVSVSFATFVTGALTYLFDDRRTRSERRKEERSHW